MFNVCKKLAEVDPNRPRDSNIDSTLGQKFEAVVDDPEKSAQILGNQFDLTCIPFNHDLRNSTLGINTNLNQTIYIALLSRAFSTNPKVKKSAAGWQDVYKPIRG